MKRNKVLDLRTERGFKIYNEIADYYINLCYGIDKQVIYSEGYTHIILLNGQVINCRKL